MRGRVNGLTLRFAGHAAFADLEHVGRRSGVVRHTPLRAFRGRGTVVVGLNFGRESDWLRNIQAAGRCRMRLGNERLELGPAGSSPSAGGSRTCRGGSASFSDTWSAPTNASSCRS